MEIANTQQCQEEGLQNSAAAARRSFRSTLFHDKLSVTCVVENHIHSTIKHGLQALLRLGAALHAAARVQLLRHLLSLQFTMR